MYTSFFKVTKLWSPKMKVMGPVMGPNDATLKNLVHTWNPNDPLFWLEKTLFWGLTFKNRGHLGSRNLYIEFIYCSSLIGYRLESRIPPEYWVTFFHRFHLIKLISSFSSRSNGVFFDGFLLPILLIKKTLNRFKPGGDLLEHKILLVIHWSSEITLFHQPEISWNNGDFPFYSLPFQVRSCEVAITWLKLMLLWIICSWKKHMLPQQASFTSASISRQKISNLFPSMSCFFASTNPTTPFIGFHEKWWNHHPSLANGPMILQELVDIDVHEFLIARHLGNTWVGNLKMRIVSWGLPYTL